MRTLVKSVSSPKSQRNNKAGFAAAFLVSGGGTASQLGLRPEALYAPDMSGMM
jgi:hypothetical protein